eukprot:TRINITY_DN695_c0_g1_i2.p1 TRINITY_DN695_c0_g1~~TRINITY_DN695_c0_g1_i2.p1  ORF type:complete len:378 (+),score=61.39 TRINITY_DN695_c0_g1_i2:456-1589(+)
METECSICMGIMNNENSTALSCGHSFCKVCWIQYLAVKIQNVDSKKIYCPSRNCKIQVDESDICEFLSEDISLLGKYKKLLTNYYVLDNKNIRWCPGPGCTIAVKVDSIKNKKVACDCGIKFCFGCGNLPHDPADCNMMKKWDKKSNIEGENAKWLASYTKECPKCNFVIHKAGGCQYIKCSNCKHNFCWICLGEFDHTNHSCNKFSYADLDPGSERAQLLKYTHFFKRYMTHSQSIKLEEKLMEQAEILMQNLADSGQSWIDVQYIKDATITLMEARRIIKYTYVYGYYLPEFVNRDLFEHLQSELESGVESLSEILESGNEKDRLIILNKKNYVSQRMKNFVEGIMEEDITGGGNNNEKTYDTDVVKYDGWIYNS